MGSTRRRAVLATALGSALAAAGCIPLAATGIAVGTIMAVDRRPISVQAADTEIELRAANRLPDAIRGASGVGVTSFNRRVLLTGQVPDEAAKAEAERTVRQIAGVREVFNELEIGPRASFGAVTNDTSITAAVRGALIERKGLSVHPVKVVTENGIVYLMGLVTTSEATGFSDAASRVAGIRRVVTLYEYLSDEELAKINAR